MLQGCILHSSAFLELDPHYGLKVRAYSELILTLILNIGLMKILQLYEFSSVFQNILFRATKVYPDLSKKHIDEQEERTGNPMTLSLSLSAAYISPSPTTLDGPLHAPNNP